jgi:Tol biopolymer transport system component
MVRRNHTLSALTTLAVVVLLTLSLLPALAGVTTRVSIASDGITQGDGNSNRPAISGDGRYVAFRSDASNLVPDDTNGYPDVFVHDRLTGQTTRVSVAGDGTEGNGFSESPSISGDARYVAFRSDASNLVPDDTNGCPDVFVHDRQTGETTRVSVASDGTQGNAQAVCPAISSDGRYVAFPSFATNLVLGDTNGWADTFVHDRDHDEDGIYDEQDEPGAVHTVRVSVASDGTQSNESSMWKPVISGDGWYVTFYTSASNLVPDDTNGYPDVFVHDRHTGETTRVSVASDGTQATGGFSDRGTISADGRYVAFQSVSSDLVDGDTNGAEDIFVHDRQTGETTRVSVASDGAQSNDDSDGPCISSDGRYVVFRSYANNLVPGDTNGYADIFVHDRQTGETTRVSVASDGTQGNGLSDYWPSISGDGRHVAFESEASNLVAGDTNGVQDIFVHDRWPPPCCFSYDPTQPTTANTLQFLDCSTAEPPATVTAWEWSFGDGHTSTDQNPTHTYAHGGCFEVTLIVTDSGGGSSQCPPQCVPVRTVTELPLCQAGWHMVSPYCGDYDLAAVQVRDDLDDVTIPFCQAANPGLTDPIWLQNPLHYYDPVQMQYQLCGCAGLNPPTTCHELRMGFGYWLYTFEPYLTLVFP